MGPFHAFVWIDHPDAHVLEFDREQVEAQRVNARSDLSKPDQAAAAAARR